MSCALLTTSQAGILLGVGVRTKFAGTLMVSAFASFGSLMVTGMEAAASSDTKGCDKILRVGTFGGPSGTIRSVTRLHVVATKNIACGDAVHSAMLSSERCWLAWDRNGDPDMVRCGWSSYRCTVRYRLAPASVHSYYYRETLHCVNGHKRRFGYSKAWAWKTLFFD